MSLDKLEIGVRIRKIRDEKFHESRDVFADRCNLRPSHIAQIERGEIMPSIHALDKIACSCGESLDYIIYGKKVSSSIRSNIDAYLDRSTPAELTMYFKCISAIKNFKLTLFM